MMMFSVSLVSVCLSVSSPGPHWSLKESPNTLSCQRRVIYVLFIDNSALMDSGETQSWLFSSEAGALRCIVVHRIDLKRRAHGACLQSEGVGPAAATHPYRLILS